mgnify:CR=1 FL=1
MKKKILAVALGLTLCFGMTGCQSVTKDFGGSTTIELEPNQKLEEITWKDDSLWYLTRPMTDDDIAETHSMIDNELRQQYRQTVDDLRIAFKKTCLYRFCEEVVKRLSKILR